MVQYVCPRCGLETTNKHTFAEHLKRKNLCEALVADVPLEPVLSNLEGKYAEKPYNCPYCDSRFSHRCNMYTHKKSCKNRPSEQTPLQTTNITGNENNTIIGGSNNTINHFHIHINPPEFTNSPYITDKMYTDLISSVKRPGHIDSVLLRMVRMLFCNMSHPENYCVYIPNKKQKMALVWDGSSWKFEETSKAVEKIRDKAYYLIVDYYDEHNYNFGLYTQQEWNAFIKRVKNGEPTVFHNADKQIGMELLDNSTKVKHCIKDKKVYSDSSQWETGN